MDDNLITYRVFDQVIRKMFLHLKSDVPAKPEEIEDIILDNLPLRCAFSLGYGTNNNVISQIHFD